MSITESIRKMTPNEAMCYDMGFENGIKVALETTSCITLDRLRELVAAERDGRVVVLPCKVGDTVWRNNMGDESEPIVAWEIAEIRIFLDEVLIIDDSDNENSPSDFGRTVFLTRAEAEAKGEQK